MSKAKLLPRADPDLPYPGTLGEADYVSMSRWTLEEAWQAQEAWIADHPGVPHGPFWWWVGILEIRGLRAQYESGDNVALLDAVHLCAMYGIPMPAWCAQTFLNKYRSVIHYEKRTWDDAFGKPHPKNVQLSAKKKKHRLGIQVYSEVRRIRQEEPDTPIDAGLFERVGKKFGLGKTLAEEYYYQMAKRLDPENLNPIAKALLEPYRSP